MPLHRCPPPDVASPSEDPASGSALSSQAHHLFCAAPEAASPEASDGAEEAGWTGRQAGDDSTSYEVQHQHHQQGQHQHQFHQKEGGEEEAEHEEGEEDCRLRALIMVAYLMAQRDYDMM